MHFILGAMAHDRDDLAFRQSLDKPEREFLPVVLDRLVAGINAASFK